MTSLDVLEQRSAAAEVVLAARDEGLTRFVGITGHDLGTPRAQLEALRRYDLDTVMFPIYPRVWADPVYRTDAEALLAECAARDVGVMVIKAAARRPWGDQDPTRSTWYEPQTDPDAIARGIAFALSTDGVHAFCTPGDLGLLPTVLDAAEADARARRRLPRRRHGGDRRRGAHLPAAGEAPPSLSGRGRRRRSATARAVEAAQTALAAATARATVSADAERTRLTRCEARAATRSATCSGRTATSARRCGSRTGSGGGSCGSPRRR